MRFWGTTGPIGAKMHFGGNRELSNWSGWYHPCKQRLCKMARVYVHFCTFLRFCLRFCAFLSAKTASFFGHTNGESPNADSQMGGGLKATLCNLCTIVCNCAHLWPFGRFFNYKGKFGRKNDDTCRQVWTIEDKNPKSPIQIPHLDFPKGPNLEKMQDRLKFSISLENFKIA